MSYSKS